MILPATLVAASFILLPHSFLGEVTSPDSVPVISYTLTPDTLGDRVAIDFRGLPDTFRLAMAVHPEYDDKYWRYIEDLRIVQTLPRKRQPDSTLQVGTVTRIGNTLFLMTLRGGTGRISYVVRPPKQPDPNSRAAWHPFSRATGSLTGGIDTFLYLPDFPNAKVTASVSWIPVGTRVATGLAGGDSFEMQRCEDYGDSTGKFIGGMCWGKRVFAPTDVSTLLDSPILLGNLHKWDFAINDIPHHIYYWLLPNAKPFDTVTFAQRITGIARAAYAIFGKAPYASYSFLFQDGAWGALEHRNSVTIGLPSADLATDVNEYNVEIAHEYFHTWNLMALRPAGWGKLSYEPAVPSSGLWWSEGVTMYYAYLLPRRLGFPGQGRSRIQQLEDDLGEYFSNIGNMRVSPERASLLADADPIRIGDYRADYYLVGRLIGDALELLVSDSTHGRHGLDEVMRTMYARHAGARGFEASDIPKAANTACECNLSTFFRDHVSSAKPLDFNAYLSSIGLTVALDTIPATDSAGNPIADTRLWANPPKSGGHLQLILFNPNSVWRKAGLHTGDELAAFDGAAIDSIGQMRRALRTIKLNDVVLVDVMRNGRKQRINVMVTGYDKVRARVTERPDITAAQKVRRERWLAGRLAQDEAAK